MGCAVNRARAPHTSESCASQIHSRPTLGNGCIWDATPACRHAQPDPMLMCCVESLTLGDGCIKDLELAVAHGLVAQRALTRAPLEALRGRDASTKHGGRVRRWECESSDSKSQRRVHRCENRPCAAAK